MDVIKRFGLPILLGFTSFISQKAHAFKLTQLKFVLNAFTQDSNSGKQVYDNTGNEDVKVFEPMLFIDAFVDEDTQISTHFTFDTWTAASDTAIDGQTGASGGGIGNQSRYAGKFSYIKGDELNGWSANLGFSVEYDYRSVSLGGTYLKSYAEDNFTLSFTPQIYFDSASDFNLRTGQTLDLESRLIWSADLTASQLLSASSLVQFGYTYINMSGMLDSIASTVKVLDETQDRFGRQGEKLPESRNRHAFHTKFVQAFSDSVAAHLSYRYYQDSWDLKAHTSELGLRWSFLDDKAFLMPTIRYYTQTNAEYYKDQFATTEQFMTSDSDLNDFSLTRYGVHFSYDLNRTKLFGFDSDIQWSIGAYQASRSTGLDYSIIQTGIGVSF